MTTSGADPSSGAAEPALLVVDDVEDNRELLTAVLAELGHRNVTTSASGREALALIARARFDLVLLDVMMPGLSGPQVLEALRGDGRLAELPVIMVSALSEMATAIKCIELGAEDYLTKPINATLLRARLNATLEKKRLRDAIREATRARLEQLDRELMAARALQLGMVPDDLDDPDTPATVHAALEPARQVGGDLCDFFFGEGDVLWFVVGDVSGKDAAAALFMARTWSSVRSVATRRGAAGVGDPGAVLAAVNAELCEANESLMFTTLFAGRLRLADGLVEFACAGHLPPFRLCAGGAVAALECEVRPPLGASPMTTYPTMRLQLAPEEGLFVYTDGVTEAAAIDGTQYSEARLRATLAELDRLPGRELLSTLVARVRAFVGEAPQADDITALLLRRRPVRA